MTRASSVERPLINDVSGVSTGQATKWRRPVIRIVLGATAVMSIGLAGLFLLAPLSKDTSPSTTPDEKHFAFVQEVLNMFPSPMNVNDANELFAHLPPHDQEDVVFAHLIPQSKHLFMNFLQRHGSSAPHWKTGERLLPRYTFEDANEFNHRLSVFEIGLRKIVKLNNVEAKYNPNPNRAIFAINQFADWTWSEFQILLGRPDTNMTGNAAVARPLLKKSQSQADKAGRLYLYSREPRHCVSGANIRLYHGKSVEECAAICNAMPGCKAFEYGVAYGGAGPYKAGDCSPQSSSDDAGCDGSKNNLDLYIKSNYIREPRHCVSGANIRLYHSKSVEECAAICNALPGCRAFEYGVAYGGTGPYKAGDCSPQSSSDDAGCDGSKINLDLYIKTNYTPCGVNWAAEHQELFKARSQDSCGSCYAHAATECLRAQAFINTGTDPGELSVQFAMDCTGHGCRGGSAGQVFDRVSYIGGIPSKATYGPYYGRQMKCRDGMKASVSTSGSLLSVAENHTADILCHRGPLAMALAVSEAFQYYHAGVLSEAACPANTSNHQTQVVGLLPAQGAWLVRNSWGSSWGINPMTLKPGGSAGFIMLSYGSNTCNVGSRSDWPKDVKLGHWGSCPPGWEYSYLEGRCRPKIRTTTKPPFSERPALCDNTCHYLKWPRLVANGACEDGGPGSSSSECSYGTDCADCGPRKETTSCNDDCAFAKDGECDEPDMCTKGTDCSDCGK